MGMSQVYKMFITTVVRCIVSHPLLRSALLRTT